jgi:hypothetical protein
MRDPMAAGRLPTSVVPTELAMDINGSDSTNGFDTARV